MLDTPTKKRIDDCRDILVGKLPDPKAQIEQITIALIYKFMDDMDKEAIELGGKAKFFSDYFIPDPNNNGKKILVEFEKFGWDNLFDAKVTATEMLSLYSEAITAIDKNPNIPQLFRDIFKNAFLPYRDPETLKLFLKTIGEFEYTHSEKLGDAFEYLLSVMGSQGDAGQFRTPRHIIDFLVAVVDPQKTDNILDPACGTAGFLISAFKHILLKDTKGNKEKLNIFQYNNNYGDEKPFNNLGDQLTPDDHKKVIKNFSGYDISPDMVRLSRVNLYLHGFSSPHIFEYDTLTSEDRWNESFDVILANPPFMSPKGGIRPHKKFSLSSNRSEVLFVDYIAEHLNTKGRAGIIVPEGVIFQSGTAYKELRRSLVENYLYAVVSLPAGVFNPYSGVKTSILLMDKELSKTSEEILFVKIDNDGFGLGAQRNAVKGGQLGEAIDVVKQFREGSFTSTQAELQAKPQAELSRSLAHAVPKAEIAKNGDYNLSGERYKNIDHFKMSNVEIVKLEDIADIEYGFTDTAKDEGDARFIRITDINEFGQLKMDSPKYINLNKEAYKYALNKNDILVARTGATFGKTLIYNNNEKAVFASFLIRINLNTNKILPKYYWAFAQSDVYWNQANNLVTGGGQPQFNGNALKQIQIPLPPISIQEEIVSEIEGYQKIIDGAKMVVENYKPKIDIDPEWELVEFKDAPFDIIDGDRGNNYPKSEDFTTEGYCLFLNTKNVRADGFSFEKLMFISKEKDELLRKGKLDREDVILTTRGTVGNTAYYSDNIQFDNMRINSGMLIFRPITEKLYPKYLFHFFQSDNCQTQIKRIISGSAQPQLPIRDLNFAKIPVPSIEIQRQIVSRIEKEQELVNASKQLIEIFEQKIKERIGKVWGEG